jgi:hypothetical protein
VVFPDLLTHVICVQCVSVGEDLEARFMSDVRPASPAAAASVPLLPPQPRLESSAAASDGETAAEGSCGEKSVDQVLLAWQTHYRKLEGQRHSEDVSEASTEESERAAARRAAAEAQPAAEQVPLPDDGGMKPALQKSLSSQGCIANMPQTTNPVPTPLAWTADPADSRAGVEKSAGPGISKSAPGQPELRSDSGQAHAQSVLLMGADLATSEGAGLSQPERPMMGGNPNLAQVELMMDSDAPPQQAGGRSTPPRPQRPLMDDSAVRAQDDVM